MNTTVTKNNTAGIIELIVLNDVVDISVTALRVTTVLEWTVVGTVRDVVGTTVEDTDEDTVVVDFFDSTGGRGEVVSTSYRIMNDSFLQKVKASHAIENFWNLHFVIMLRE